jgi:hypothetical protein
LTPIRPRIWLVLLALGLWCAGHAAPLSLSPTASMPDGAARYLRLCVTAVQVAQLGTPSGRLSSAWHGRACTDAPCDLNPVAGSLTVAEVSRPQGAAASRVEVGQGWPEGFRVVLTGQSGERWAGAPGQLPAVLPRTSRLPPDQQAAARAQAVRVAADAYLRACVTALAEFQATAGAGLGADWEGATCADARLRLPDANAQRPTIVRSVIHLQGGTSAGYTVSVTGVGGVNVRWPSVAAVQAEQAQAQRDRLNRALGGLAWAPLAVLLLWVSVYRLPGWPVLAGFGIFGVGSILVLVVFVTVVRSVTGPAKHDFPFELFGLYALVAGLTFAVPRLVVRAGQEKWWVSLGTGYVAMYLSSWVVALLLTLAERVGLGRDTADTTPLLWSLLFVAVLITLWNVAQRVRSRRPQAQP